MQALQHSVPPTLQHSTSHPSFHGRLLDTQGQVWVSLLWGHCSFLLGPGAHKALFVPSMSLFPQFCVISGSSMVELMATSSKRAYAILKNAALRVPAPFSWILVRTRFCLCPPRASYPYPSEGRQDENHNHRKLIKSIT